MGSRCYGFINLLFLGVILTLSTADAPCQSGEVTTVSGVIVDDSGVPVESANVQIVGTLDGGISDLRGRFRFTSSHSGEQILQASLIGMKPVMINVILVPGDSVSISIGMTGSILELGGITVTAGGYTLGDDVKGTTLSSLEVLTTPGASADIFRAVQTLPGVSSINEGSGLFVRGGDQSETVVLLDQATVTHPYKYETPTGGVFGTIPPFLVDGTYFSTGGFSALYGNALSSILAMESKNLPMQPRYLFGVGLAAASVECDIPVIPGTLGIRASGNQSSSDIMFRVNGMRDQFVDPPKSYDGNLSVVYKYSPSGQLKLFSFANQDAVGVRINEPSFDGVFQTDESTWLHNLQWSDALGGWFLKGSISQNTFSKHQAMGNLDYLPSDKTTKLRLDADRPLTDNVHLSVGAELEHLKNEFVGSVPVNTLVLDPSAPVFLLDEVNQSDRYGVYAQLETNLSHRLKATTGVRGDYHTLSNQVIIDPRCSLQYNISPSTQVRANWGIYHQFPEPYLYNAETGNLFLRAEKAQQFIAGLESSREDFMVRVEAYHKSYSHMVLQDATNRYANRGDGVANGVDVFLKYGAFLQTPINGWVSYSFLHSQRMQVRDVVDHFEYETGPSPFDITHSLTIVAKGQVVGLLSLGATYRIATGQPETPVINAVHISQGDYYLPVQGRVNSVRLSGYSRLDVTLSYLVAFGDLNSAVFYCSVTNLLNRANETGFEYSKDYLERRVLTSEYRRFIYFGVAVALGGLSPDTP